MTEWDRFLLELALWREARDQQDDAITAVACSIRNRTLKTTWWNGHNGGSYAAVILHPFQYSSFNRNDPNAVKFPMPEDAVLLRIQPIAAAVFGDKQPDTVQGAQSYFSGAFENLSENAQQGFAEQTHVCDIGDFHFYRV